MNIKDHFSYKDSSTLNTNPQNNINEHEEIIQNILNVNTSL